MSNPLSSNPLLVKVKLPGRVFGLPSKGLFYKPGVLADTVRDGEIQIKPMSALAEMKLRSADLLYSGKVLRELCVECAPEILKPESLLTKDVDALFVFLRIVTYGSRMDVNSVHDCDEAKVHKYQINIEESFADPHNTVLEHKDTLYRVTLINGQVVTAKPPTYEAAMQVVHLRQQIARLESENKRPDDMMVERVLITDLLAVIEAVTVDGPEGKITVNNVEHITEWIRKMPKPLLNELVNAVQKTDQWGFSFKIPLTCKDCNQSYEHNLEIDPINFFFG